MQKLKRIFILLGIFGLTVLSLLAANEIERMFPEWRSLVAVFTGCFFGILLYLLISKIMQIYNYAGYKNYNLHRSIISGFLLGIGAFGVSILILYFYQGHLSLNPLSIKEILDQVLFQFRPAIIEEVGFRFGLVSLALFFAGRNAALVAGSIPFGLLHLLNFIGGQPIFWDYIIGTSVAGLFLSLVFLNFGLIAAITTHYIWNVLASLSSKLFSIQQEVVEGGMGTLAVLLILSILLFHRQKKLREPGN